MPDGILNSMLEGKTVEKAYKDGQHLIIHTTDGHEVFIGWKDGEPVHIKTSVRIVLPSVSLFGVASSF